MARSFRWQDGERLIVFGEGAAAHAVATLGGPGYTLLTTERAKEAAPGVVTAAGEVHTVPSGHVDDLAASLLDAVSGDRIVALGGGRVVDVAKAIVAAQDAGAGGAAHGASGAFPGAGAAAAHRAFAGPLRAMAIPTTLSGAEMTRIHRHAAGVAESTPRVRPAVVIIDPALAASQPVAELAASSLNALGHAVEAPSVINANPVATLAAHEAARLLAAGWQADEPDREALALGSLLAGYALDNTALALHHVLAQTLVRVAGLAHGPANAAVLPVTIGALAKRTPDAIAALNAAVGEDLVQVALRVRERTGAGGLRDLGVEPAVLAACADAAATRPQLKLTPPPADRVEILGLYENAL
ncbi:iron-containing alcohol dehydrogenase [Solirubrobacter phytolaccae]|uniref:Iron-containing alcohol dehydrogenase n=1 Tax=Solirubrobacter phytolaccae TaxID=1404360 RepID=A0A9X3NCY6_9ACTN|nr:iron-containing alcohol dehydrogenase [Solirubrobacter phytolaccae]MDA0183764.1 iron-containing alcohol dehydrogenase [Solirubrobacter phytolaccae]